MPLLILFVGHLPDDHGQQAIVGNVFEKCEVLKKINLLVQQLLLLDADHLLKAISIQSNKQAVCFGHYGSGSDCAGSEVVKSMFS